MNGLRFFETIRRGGSPILSEASTARMMRNQTAHPPSTAQGPLPGWGFGFGGSVLTDPSAAGSPQSRGTTRSIERFSSPSSILIEG